MKSRPVRITNDLGLHLRAAGALARTASRYESEIRLTRGTQAANAKSIMSLLALAAAVGTELELVTEGPDEAEAIDSVASLIAGGFEEK